MGSSGAPERGSPLNCRLLLRCRLLALHGHIGGTELRPIADGYRIPIILLAANCNEENRNRVLNGGALCVLDKPLDEELLFEWLRRVCFKLILKSG